jgi:hypothetical protein
MVMVKMQDGFAPKENDRGGKSNFSLKPRWFELFLSLMKFVFILLWQRFQEICHFQRFWNPFTSVFFCLKAIGIVLNECFWKKIIH